jgi:hypothetical protein
MTAHLQSAPPHSVLADHNRLPHGERRRAHSQPIRAGSDILDMNFAWKPQPPAPSQPRSGAATADAAKVESVPAGAPCVASDARLEPSNVGAGWPYRIGSTKQFRTDEFRISEKGFALVLKGANFGLVHMRVDEVQLAIDPTKSRSGSLVRRTLGDQARTYGSSDVAVSVSRCEKHLILALTSGPKAGARIQVSLDGRVHLFPPRLANPILDFAEDLFTAVQNKWAGYSGAWAWQGPVHYRDAMLWV